MTGDTFEKKVDSWWPRLHNCHRIQFRTTPRMREGIAKILSQWGLAANEDPDLQLVARAVFLYGLETLADVNPVKRRELLAAYVSSARGKRGRPPYHP